MNDRNVIILAAYAAVLGWCAHTWWRRERQSIVNEAAWDAQALDALKRQPSPAPAPAEPST